MTIYKVGDVIRLKTQEELLENQRYLVEEEWWEGLANKPLTLSAVRGNILSIQNSWCILSATWVKHDTPKKKKVM